MIPTDIAPRTYAPRGYHGRSTTRSRVGTRVDCDEPVTKHSVVEPTKVVADPMMGDGAKCNPSCRHRIRLSTCHLWAPACTTTFFKKHYLPLLKGPGRAIRDFALYTLSDTAERDDHCAHIYNKSLLYLVSNAFEEEYHPLQWGRPGAPLLGMEKFIRTNKEIHDLFNNQSATWSLAPNSKTHILTASKSTSYGGFDDAKAAAKFAFSPQFTSKTFRPPVPLTALTQH